MRKTFKKPEPVQGKQSREPRNISAPKPDDTQDHAVGSNDSSAPSDRDGSGVNPEQKGFPGLLGNVTTSE
jgi:hypothetical protein